MRRARLFCAAISGIGLLALVWWSTGSGTAEPSVAWIEKQSLNDARANDSSGVNEAEFDELLELLASGNKTRDESARTAELLEKHSAGDPLMGLEMASAESSRAHRLKWVSVVLERWAAEAPDGAIQWTVNRFPRDPDARDAAFEAVVRGVARTGNVDAAETLLSRLNSAFPEGAATRRWHFVTALGEGGAYDRAGDFSIRAEGDDRGDLLQVAFETWANARPDEAAMAARAIGDAPTRAQAWQAVVSRLAGSDPEKLTKMAIRMNGGPERRVALAHALPQWILKAPASASAWLEQQSPSAELDSGTAAIAGFAPLARQRPDVAMGWAESIVNAQLREQTMAGVLEIWMQVDPAAAQTYVTAQTP